MLGYLKRLVTTGAAYQFGDILAKGLALLTLPLYTRHVEPERLRRGRIAADGRDPLEHPAARRRRRGVHPLLLRRRGRRAARPHRAHGDGHGRVDDDGRRARSRSPSRARSRGCCCGFERPELIDCAVLGLWAFTNLEMAYAQLRVDERARTYVFASGANVAHDGRRSRSSLVVFADQGARGPAARQLRRLGARRARPVVGAAPALLAARARGATCGAMLRFGLPTVPADASVYALQVADRFYLFRVLLARAPPGLYAVAIKLATVVFVAVRGFQYAWPPLAYSIESDEEAGAPVLARHDLLRARDRRRRLRASRCSGAGWCGCWPRTQYFGAYRALPWLALGWALYGLYLVFVVIAGRARVTSRNLPAAAAGLAVNVAAAPAARARQRRRARHRRRRDRAVRRLRGDARRHVPAHARPVPASASNGAAWRSSSRSSRASRSPASCCCRRSGLGGLAGARRLARARARRCCCSRASSTRTSAPRRAALVADGRRRVAAFRAGHGEVEAYAEDPLRDL